MKHIDLNVKDLLMSKGRGRIQGEVLLTDELPGQDMDIIRGM